MERLNDEHDSVANGPQPTSEQQPNGGGINKPELPPPQRDPDLDGDSQSGARCSELYRDDEHIVIALSGSREVVTRICLVSHSSELPAE